MDDDRGRSRVIFHDVLNDMMDWLGIAGRSTSLYNDTLAREKAAAFRGRR